MSPKATPFTAEQKEFLRKLMVEEGCVSTQIVELTGIKTYTATSFGKLFGVNAAASRVGRVTRIKLARKTAEMKRKYAYELKTFFDK